MMPNNWILAAKWEASTMDLSQNEKILRQVFFSWERGDQV